MNIQDRNTCDSHVIGYWISDKKRKKFNWTQFEEICLKKGLILKKIDIEMDIEGQGPFDVFLNKLSDILAHADSGDKYSKTIISRVEEYIKNHPEVIIIDPLDHVRNLRDRYRSYELIRNGLQGSNNVFIPNFVEIKSTDLAENIQILRDNKMRFPCICKPLLAHGSSDSHKMMVVFNEADLKDCLASCVIQEFVNHNAILYKVFVVIDTFHLVERPSFKNFYVSDCEKMSTIFFKSHDISKSSSNSKWSIIEDKDVGLAISPSHEIIESIVKKMRKIFGLFLLGIDVVVENHTGKYAIIDVNTFPGYDGYSNFFEDFASNVKKLLSDSSNAANGINSEKNGFGFCF